ncbi:MAG: hypothetical protein WDW38_003069 [Sanguina aurantia]
MQISRILQDQPHGCELLEEGGGPNFITGRLQEGGRWKPSSAQIKYLHFLPAASADLAAGFTAPAMGNGQVPQFHTSTPLPKGDFPVTATAVDPSRRRLWTGQEDGTITLHLDQRNPLHRTRTQPPCATAVAASSSPTYPNVSAAAENSDPGNSPTAEPGSMPGQPAPSHTYATTGAATSCMSVGSDGTLWVGDRSGRVTRLRPLGHVVPEGNTSNTVDAASALPTTRASVRSMAPAAAAPFLSPPERFPSVRTVVPSGSSGSGSAEICAILATRHSGVFSADVTCQLFQVSVELYAPVRRASCVAYGQVTALVEIPWAGGGNDGGGGGSSRAASPKSAAASSQRGVTLPVTPEHSSTAAGSEVLTGLHQKPVQQWRLLSGHTHGQILVWDLGGPAPTIAAAIGKPMPAVVSGGLSVFLPSAVMVSAHVNGSLLIWPVPCSEMELMVISAGGVPAWTVAHATIRAHSSKVLCCASGGGTIATASKHGSVRLWDVRQLRSQALQQGIPLLSHAAHKHPSAAEHPSAASTQRGPISHQPSWTRSLRTALTRQSEAPGPSQLNSNAYSLSPHPSSGPLLPQTSFLSRNLDPASGGFSAGCATPIPVPLQLQISCYTHNQAPTPFANVAAQEVTLGLCQRGVVSDPSAQGPRQHSPNGSRRRSDPVPGQALQGGGASANHASEDWPAAQGGGSELAVTHSAVEGAPTPFRLSGSGTLQFDLEHMDHGPTAQQFIDSDDLQLIELVGCGSEGSVWRGKWRHIDVAIKEMHHMATSFARLKTYTEHNTCKQLAGMMNEVKALLDLSQHPNIVHFIGVGLEPPRIVTEFYHHGSIFDILHKAQGGDHHCIDMLAWNQRLSLLLDVASGMEFLHSRNYVHGDLRSPNVFVTSDNRAKIGDFGFCQLLGVDGASTADNQITNPRWLAPEVLQAGQSTKEGDVFSFSIIMWEIITWKLPFEDMETLQIIIKHARGVLRPVIPDQADLMALPTGLNLQPYLKLMEDCWSQDPAARPTFGEVATRMSALLHWADAFKAIRTRINAKGVVGALKNMVTDSRAVTADTPTVVSEAAAILGTAFSLPVTADGLPLSPRSHKLAMRRQNSQPAPSMLQYGASGDKAGYTGASGTIANAVATLKLQLSARKVAAAELASDARDGLAAGGPSFSVGAVAAEDVSDSERASGNSLPRQHTTTARATTPPPAAESEPAVGNGEPDTGEPAPAADTGRSVFNPQAKARRSSLTFHVNAAVGGGPAPSSGSHTSTCSNLCTSPRTLSWTLPTAPGTNPVHTVPRPGRMRGGRESHTPGSPSPNPNGLSNLHLDSNLALRVHTVERSTASVPGLSRKGSTGMHGPTQTGSPTSAAAAAAAVPVGQQRRRRHSVLFPGGSVPVHDSSSLWSAILASGMLPSAEGRPSCPAALPAAVSDRAHSTMTLQRVHSIAAYATASTPAHLAPAAPAQAAPSASPRQPAGGDAEAVGTGALTHTMTNAQPEARNDVSPTVTTPHAQRATGHPAVSRTIPRARLAVSTANSPVKAKPALLPQSRSADGASPAADSAAPTPTAHAPPLRSAMRAVASEFGERDRRSPSIHRAVSYKAAAGCCVTAASPPHSTTAEQPGCSGGDIGADPHSPGPSDEDLLVLAMPPFALNRCSPNGESVPAPSASQTHTQHGTYPLGRSTAAKGMAGNASSVQEPETAGVIPRLASSTPVRHSPTPPPPTPAVQPATEPSTGGPTLEMTSHALISPFGPGLACLLLGPESSASSDPSRRFGHTRASPDTPSNLVSAFLCPGLAASLLGGGGPSAGERLTLPVGAAPSKPKAPLPPYQAGTPPLPDVMAPLMSPAFDLIPSPFCSPSLASMLLGAHGTASAGAASH